MESLMTDTKKSARKRDIVTLVSVRERFLPRIIQARESAFCPCFNFTNLGPHGFWPRYRLDFPTFR